MIRGNQSVKRGINIKYIAPKQFHEIYGNEILGHGEEKGKKYIITLPHKSSTRTRLHELGHTYYRHSKSFMESFINEIKADIYVRKCCNKKIDYRIVIPALAAVPYYTSRKPRLTILFAFTLFLLDKKYHIILNKWQRSYIWQFCKLVCKRGYYA